MARPTVAEAVADELLALRVDRVFGLPGGEILDLVEATRTRGIEFVLCRHEANAGVMAGVYGNLRNVPGVVFTTLGPGAANLLLPLASSRLEREPLIAISAQLPQSWPGSHIHQRLPLKDVYGPVTKRAETLRPFNCRSLLRTAGSECMEQPRGACFFTLSAEDARSPAEEVSHSVAAPSVASRRAFSSPLAAAEELRERLAGAERPLVAVGLGTNVEATPLIREWTRKWRLPTVTTPKAKGIFDETDSAFVGVIGGMAIDSLMMSAVEQADVIVGLGLDPVEINRPWHVTAPIIWMLEAPWATGAVPSTPWTRVDQIQLLHSLVDMAPPREWVDWCEPVRRQRRDIYERDDAAQRSPLALVRNVAARLPADTIVTTDVGAHKFVFGQFWPCSTPQTMLMSNGLSGMGYGLPAAIAAKLARPERIVLSVLGDGGFSMNCGELETATRLGLSLIVLVLADRSYSLIRLGQQARQLPRHGVDFGPVDNAAIARACGFDAVTTTDAREAGDVAHEAAATGRATLIEYCLDVDEYVGIV